MAMQLKVIAGAEKDMGRTFDLPEQGSLHLAVPRTPTPASTTSASRVLIAVCTRRAGS